MIEDTSSPELLSAMESNNAAFYAAYGRASGCTLHATAEVVWFYTGLPVALFNGVLCCHSQADGVKATVDSLQSLMDERGAPALWWIGPETRPDNLDELLERYGLQRLEAGPGMAIDLALVDTAPETIAGFTVQKVSGVEMQMLWARIAGRGTEFPDAATEAVVRLEATLADPQYKAQRRYIGFLHGAPVATSALVLESGLAGIYAVATIPEARRQGIGKAMTVRPLLEAKQLGYRVGVLQASPMGYPIYRKIGFKDVCQYKLYLQSQARR